MNPSTPCPKCGSPIAADAPHGICPRCLINRGLETTVGSSDRGDPVLLNQRLGSYQIERLLGCGGMGAVYEAQHLETGRKVALKVLNDKLQSPEHRQRFLREGRLAASNNHPNAVYVFGTEEIDGLPVIAMEMVHGGTLQDRVRTGGPMPIDEAVDSILDIIAGLEAAAQSGVLHRDVKPANCFVDSDGTVKVGDFGLSISTAPRAETFETASGVILGTPAFSSPEQLRGDDLTVRSDIYSVGVTLYYLLTGQTPFQADQMVRLLAMVLEGTPPAPTTIRPEIPKGLSRVVLKCLSRQSTQRFEDYDQLRRALMIYSSAAPTPGTLGLRFLAGAVDFLVITLLASLLPILWVSDLVQWEASFSTLTDPAPQRDGVTRLTVTAVALHLLYFTLSEGLVGTTPGKAISGLQVVRAGSEHPGILRAMIRATIYFSALWLPSWAYYLSHYPSVLTDASGSWVMAAALSSIVLMMTLFATARKRNGLAAVHDKVSGTRVVRPRSYQKRPSLECVEEPLPEAEAESKIGPYHLLGLVDPQMSDLLLGYDTRLLRKVWIRRCPADQPRTDAKLCGIARIGRLRWLNGRCDDEVRWDAYEAPGGRPLLAVAESPQPWESVRFWLSDLAEELDAGIQDGSLPAVLGLDRVWISSDGRAKLLEFPAPSVTDVMPTQDAAASHERITATTASASIEDLREAAARFLKDVAVVALEGRRCVDGDVATRSVAAPLPPTVAATLNALGNGKGEPLPVAEFKAFTSKPATVSLAKRTSILVACWAVPLLMTGYAATLLLTEKQFLSQHPQLGELAGYVNYYHSLGEPDVHPSGGDLPTSDLRQAVAITVAHRFRQLVGDQELWEDPLSHEFVDLQGQELLKRFVASHPDPSADEIRDAGQLLKPAAEQIRYLGWRPQDYRALVSGPMDFLMLLSFVLAIAVVLPSLLCAIAFGNSLLLRCLDIAIVTSEGREATRWRVLGRNLVLWLLVALGIGVVMCTAYFGRPRVMTIFVVAGMIGLFITKRGLHDEIAGTWLVPR